MCAWTAESHAGALDDLMGAMRTLHAKGYQRPFTGAEGGAKSECLDVLRTVYWGSVQGGHGRMLRGMRAKSTRKPACLLSHSHRSPLMTQTQNLSGAHARGTSRPVGARMAG